MLVVAGYTHEDEGEYIPVQMGDTSGTTSGGDRVDLTLGEKQEALILAAAAENPKTVVAVMSGSAVVMEAWRHQVAGVVMLWYPGMQGGAALADVLFGRVNPSGRLPFTIPKRADDLPFFDREANEIIYDLWHGYTRFERANTAPAYPFGFGLGYSDFEYSEPGVRVDEKADRLEVDVRVWNAGERQGDTVLQIYAGVEKSDTRQPAKRLCGFRRVSLEAGARESVTVAVALRDLASFDVASQRWRVSGAPWRIWAGSSSDATGLKSVSVRLPARAWSVGDESV